VLDATVSVFNVFADDQKIYILKWRFDAGNAFTRAQVDVEVQRFANRDVDGLVASADRRCRGPFQGYAIEGDFVHAVGGDALASFFDAAQTSFDVVVGNICSGGFKDLYDGFGNLGTDAIAPDEGDFGGRIRHDCTPYHKLAFRRILVVNLSPLSYERPMSSSSESASVVVPATPRPEGSPLAGVKHIIAIGSGKGGVGKSTTAVNLAVALKKLGARVGLMDADIYGPSLPKLMGLSEAPVEMNGKIAPPVIHGIKCMSMGLLGGDAPIVWRGPMASRAVSQFLSEVDWGELDYLIVDLPPGTGDIQLTLAQSIRLSAAVVVMTPQALASEIARRGLKMFQQVRVPVLGLVENMSEYECPSCGHKSHLFSQGGGDAVSKELGLPILQRFPLDPQLLEDSDNGIPVVISRPESKSAGLFLDLARNMAAELSTLVSGGRTVKPIVVTTEPNEAHKMLKLSWNDGKQSVVAYKELRYLCPCAVCVDENTGVRKIRKEDVRADVHPSKIQTVGNYALGIHWSDGHSTGLYAFDYLRKILVPEATPASL